MNITRTIADLRAHLAPNRREGGIVLVPTMGNLHQGHINLVRRARALGNTVVASIFVNPLQFLPHEDFQAYPRTFEADCARLADASCDLVFAPADEELYPQGRAGQGFRVSPPPELSDILEGHFRPGFFTGVCTVVLKLFNAVSPDVAVFGKKDYQQWRVIEGMVRQLNLPIKIVAEPTAREADGLAMSSRNGYLSADERYKAVFLSQTLKRLADLLHQEKSLTASSIQRLENDAADKLSAQGWQVDYVAVRHSADLSPIHHEVNLSHSPSVVPLVVLAAARLGKTRLIDNLEINAPAPQ